MASKTLSPVSEQPRSRPYRGLDPEARRAERRDRLLAATLDLTAAQGFARTTIHDICRSSGVTARHFYEEFGSREELLEALYQGIMQETADAVINALAGVPTDLDTMARAGLSAYIHSMVDDPRKAHVILFEVFSLPEGVRIEETCVHTFVALLEDLGEMLAARGQLIDVEIHDTSVAISGAIKELLVYWIRSEPRRPVDEMIDSALSIFRRLVRLPDRELA